MTRKHLLKDRIVTAYWSVISMLSAGLITMQPVMAASIFDRVRSIVTLSQDKLIYVLIQRNRHLAVPLIPAHRYHLISKQD